jgi:sulfatase maturation enzyme AslB (radical SAM superfamily)
MASAEFPLSDRLARPLRDLRISVTDRCQFRCTYCMPREVFGPDFAFLPRAELLTFEELARLARVFASLGVRKLRLTGGEPLLRRDLERLIAMLAGIGGIQARCRQPRTTLRRARPGSSRRRARRSPRRCQGREPCTASAGASRFHKAAG